MMTSLDGRIDCAMTSKLKGVDDYYATLDALNVPTTVSGRVTAELEMALEGKFKSETCTPYGKTGFAKNADAAGCEVVIDSKGTLLWPDAEGMDKPYLIITSSKVSKEYLDYLDSGLLDEISILIGAGIDGRRMPSVFDGREADTDVIPLQLSDVQKFASGAVWLRYKV